jgi:RNA polymerase sigma-70 factor (ECF subfamily)
VIEIHQLNDTSIEQVAKLAGISITATKSRLLRARAILRRALDPHQNGAMPHRPEIFTEPALGSLAK